jgi:hypothetical protein
LAGNLDALKPLDGESDENTLLDRLAVHVDACLRAATPRGDKMSATCRMVAVPARQAGDNKGPPPQR